MGSLIDKIIVDKIPRKYTLIPYVTKDKIHCFKIMATKSFGKVRRGDEGGIVLNKDILSHTGNCWIGKDASVLGNCRVTDNALIDGDAQLEGFVVVSGDSVVNSYAHLIGIGPLTIKDKCLISGDVKIVGKGTISDATVISGGVEIYGSIFTKGSVDLRTSMMDLGKKAMFHGDFNFEYEVHRELKGFYYDKTDLNHFRRFFNRLLKNNNKGHLLWKS